MNDNQQLPDGFPYSPPLSEEAAVALIWYIIGDYESIVNNAFPSKTFTQWQYDAMVDHAYGWGEITGDLQAAIVNGITGDALKNVFYEYDHMWNADTQQYEENDYLKKILYTEYHLYTTGSYDFIAEGDSPNPPPNPVVGDIVVQYSQNKTNWRIGKRSTDNWKRISLDKGYTWGSPIRIYSNSFLPILIGGRR
jgi:hypothetical protein